MRKQYNCHVRSFAGFCVLLASCMTASVAALSSEAPKSFIGGEPLQQEKNTGATGVASNGVIQVVPGAYMLGDIEPGSEHTRTFVIKNLSAQPVRIQRSVTSCKCTTTTNIDGITIPANGSVNFDAVLAAPRTPGNKNAKVQILFDGGFRPLTMQMEGDVTMRIKASPAYVGGPRGENNSGMVLLESIDGKPFSILTAGGFKPEYVGFNPETDEPKSRYTLRWDVTKIADLPRRVWWVVYTDNQNCPVLPLRIRNGATGSKADMARFQRFWIFDENLVNAETLIAGNPVDLTVVIKHYNPRGRGKVEKPQWGVVKSVRSLSPDITTELVSSKPLSEEEVRVTFRLTPRSSFSGPLYALVAVETATGVGEFGVVGLVQAKK